MNTYQATRLIAARELRVKLRDRTFIFSTLFFLVIIAASAVVPAMISHGPTTVAVADATTAQLLTASTELEVVTVGDDAEAEQRVRAGEVDAAVINGPVVVAMDEAPQSVVTALSSSPPVQLLNPDAVHPVALVLVPLVFALVFFFISTMFGTQIAQSVTEEKQTRIAEILVAAVPVRALMLGKVLAGGALALGQIGLIAVVALIGLRMSDSGPLLTLIAPALGWFVPFFVIGFVMLAALWAVAGALVSRQEDIASVALPLQVVIMIPFFAVAMFSSNDTLMRVLSYLPFSAPTAMPIRLFTGDAAGWEPVVALVVLLLTTAVSLLVGARLYEGSLLRTNSRTSVATAWREREQIG
ncbi:ABC transporter permease [Melissospora conviva]|uniref:ABC transporter permease n=1 Tax=Melissospora conviva TaxID=3388432 RepID=UPI003B81F2E0